MTPVGGHGTTKWHQLPPVPYSAHPANTPNHGGHPIVERTGQGFGPLHHVAGSDAPQPDLAVSIAAATQRPRRRATAASGLRSSLNAPRARAPHTPPRYLATAATLFLSAPEEMRGRYTAWPGAMRPSQIHLYQ